MSGGPQGIGELPPISLGDRMPADAIAARPFPARQVMRPEQAVEQREMHGEIDVDRLALDPMMPMVKLRGGDDVAQPAKIEPYVGVQKGRVQEDVKDVGL